MKHNKDNYDAYNIHIYHYNGGYTEEVMCEGIEDVDDLMVCLEQESKNNALAKTVLDILKSILDGRIK